jgi:hypothetical protein
VVQNIVNASVTGLFPVDSSKGYIGVRRVDEFLNLLHFKYVILPGFFDIR